MSGHSKWATTKHKKAIIDSRRAKNFAKLIKAIEVSARSGGADVSGNPTLFDAIAKAKDYNKDVSIVFSSGVEYVCDIPYDELVVLILRNQK